MNVHHEQLRQRAAGWAPQQTSARSSAGQQTSARSSAGQQTSARSSAGQQIALFCFASSERLLGTCWSFQAHTGVPVTSAALWIGKIFSEVIAGAVDPASVDVAERAISEGIPQSDDFGFPLATQAQSALICGLIGVRAVKERSEDLGAVMGASDYALMGVDNYLSHIADALTGSCIYEEPAALMLREEQKQLEDARFLSEPANLTPSCLTRWRANNLEYAVPPAVDLTFAIRGFSVVDGDDEKS